MTCIIGFTDKEHGVSWIGGDSLGSNGYTKSSELSAKVFRNELFKNVHIGGTTTFRHLDLLRYSEDRTWWELHRGHARPGIQDSGGLLGS